MAGLHVFCWPGRDQLPSFDPLCLSVIAYSRFCAIPDSQAAFHKCTGYNQYTSDLPIVYTGDKAICGAHSVLDYFRSRGWNADYILKTKEKADTMAFLSLIRTHLHPAILYLQFVKSQNYADVIRGYYATACSFPWNFYVPGQLEKRAREAVALKGENVEKTIIVEAKHCLDLLSSFLGDQQFFFGDRPTTLDAISYGYLAFILNSNLPSNDLKPHVLSLENLAGFTARFGDQYMRSVTSIGMRAPEEAPVPQQSFFTSNRKAQLKKWGSIGFGLVAMVTYAFLSGLIEIEIREEEEEEDEGEEEINN
ncbi:metaxin-1-like [Oscarella lobularis]|uniref:metaxin-1-like n=1 Tax=Oscarella lobularis TaxID=121494 RepID=UPI0033142660